MMILSMIYCHMIKDVDIDDKYIPKKDNDNVEIESEEADIDELGNVNMMKKDNNNKVPEVTTINRAVQNSNIMQEKKQDSKDKEHDKIS